MKPTRRGFMAGLAGLFTLGVSQPPEPKKRPSYPEKGKTYTPDFTRPPTITVPVDYRRYRVLVRQAEPLVIGDGVILTNWGEVRKAREGEKPLGYVEQPGPATELGTPRVVIILV